MRVFHVVFLMLLASPSWSAGMFQQHVQNTADALTAFYMFGLSEGDQRYLDDFESYLIKADSAISLAGEQDKQQFLERWQQLKPFLKYKSIKGMGYYLERIVQIEARTYLTDIYLHELATSKKLPLTIDKLDELKLIISMLSNRSLDIMISNTGRAFLQEYGKQIVEEELIKDVAKILEELAALNLTAKQNTLLNKVGIRFNFVRKKLMASDQIVPIYIVYNNLRSVDKLLRAAQIELAVN